MKSRMKRFFYISESLDELATVEQELKAAGIAEQQIHVFSRDDAGTEQRQLHSVQEFMKRDVVRSASRGAFLGVILAALALVITYYSGVTHSLGWAPFLLLAVVILGFCTWEGGLFGLHVPHHELRDFERALREDKHILFVDVRPQDVLLLNTIQARHPSLKPAGEGTSTPGWAILWQKKWQDFIRAMP
jgi:hypothetical protein